MQNNENQARVGPVPQFAMPHQSQEADAQVGVEASNLAEDQLNDMPPTELQHLLGVCSLHDLVVDNEFEAHAVEGIASVDDMTVDNVVMFHQSVLHIGVTTQKPVRVTYLIPKVVSMALLLRHTGCIHREQDRTSNDNEVVENSVDGHENSQPMRVNLINSVSGLGSILKAESLVLFMVQNRVNPVGEDTLLPARQFMVGPVAVLLI